MAAAPAPAPAHLEIRDLTISFGGLVAVQGLDLVLRRGEIVGLIGPNGAGKTTVFNCISRFYTPDRGTISFAGQEITRVAPHQVIRRGIARTFQNVELCRSMTTLENLLVGQHATVPGGLFADLLRLRRGREAALHARAEEVMDLLGLAPFRDRPVASLPFGVQKTIELARALVSRPALILLDEPAAGADTVETSELTGLIRRIRDLFDVSILLVEHDMSLVMDLCDRIYVLDFGKKIAEGLPSEIQRNPAVIEAYLGESIEQAPVAEEELRVE